MATSPGESPQKALEPKWTLGAGDHLLPAQRAAGLRAAGPTPGDRASVVEIAGEGGGEKWRGRG